MHQYPDIKRAFKLCCKFAMRRLYLPKGFKCVEMPSNINTKAFKRFK